jgi:hypothetical protein
MRKLKEKSPETIYLDKKPCEKQSGDSSYCETIKNSETEDSKAGHNAF